MKRNKQKKLLSLFMSLVLILTGSAWTQLVEVKAKTAASDSKKENILKLTMDEKGYLTPQGDSLEMLEKKAFSWDNVTSYFVLTDRFLNSDESNDHSYGRGLKQDGTPVDGLDYKSNPGTFHGGDLNGLTQKVEEGYFNDLGVNAIWITAPYEQVHGYTSANVKSNNASTYPDPDGQGFPYYSYHGYWTLDYTNIDANMGTAEDFEHFVDSCHERGIRVIMDIVMNHVGYTTMQDAVDYGFDGALKDGTTSWKNYYYGNATYLMGGDPEAQNFWNKDSDVWASRWWGPGFVRASYPGYTPAGGDDHHMSLSGLPDVITESSAAEVPTPPLLVSKWTKEGRYSKEQSELDKFFSTNNYKKQPRYYIIKWLTDYVREYGVDGFRCDTAKHVDLDAWNDLKKEGVKALKEWRANNPDKPGAKWTDDFWMTGEAWGHGMGKSEYFTQGGFDSMINFQFNKSGNPSGMEDTYSSYAGKINSDDSFNVLSYLKSHDDSDSTMGVWKSSSQGMINQGTCLLLAPGGVQIYYGDEINRGLGWESFFTGRDYLDQRFRTDMDWNNYDKACLAHWQKVGQFRNNHISVGAGQHQKLDGDVYTFSRTYHLEEDDEDKVVVAVPGKAGEYSISVGDIFEDGETVTDFYSGKKYEVGGSKVNATCDENGVILLEGSGIVKPSVSAKTKGKSDNYTTDTVDITLRGNKVKDTFYSINGGKKVSFKPDDVITIGGDTAYEEKTTLVLTGISEEDGSVVKKEYTYQRSKEPTVSDGIFCIKVKKSEFSEAPNIYVYSNDSEEKELAGKWPGALLTEDQDDPDYLSYTNESISGDALIILSTSSWRSAPDGAKGLVAQGCMLYDKSSNTVEELPSGVPGKVTVNYKDTSGKILKSIYRVGVVGRNYKTYPANIEGYTLKTKPANAEGKYEENVEVNYIYSNGGVDPTVPSVDPTVPSVDPTVPSVDPTVPSVDPTVPSVDPTVPSVDPTVPSVDPTVPSVDPTVPSEDPTVPSVDPTVPSEDPTVPSEDPTVPSEEPTKPSEDPTERPISSLKVTGFSVSIASGIASVGDRISLAAKTKGGEGKVQYRFMVTKGTTNIIKNYSTSRSAKWTPKTSGRYELKVYAKDSTGKIAKKSISKFVVNSKLKIKSFKVTPGSKKAKKGSKVKLSVSASGGSKKYSYKFAYKYQGSKKVISINKYSSKKTYVWKPKKTGKYTLYVYVKDKSKNKVVKREIKNYVVK